ncbi:MAG TPA: EF-hand domain-containing protein [Burkholderiales bacterium]|nr:EF-hand domain-containing protein [Burkholderiales bacterium]
MKLKAMTVLLMLASWSVVGGIRAADNLPPPVVRAGPPVPEATFRALDMDGDGYISRSEVRRGTYLQRYFDQLDVNRDGRLSREELGGMYAVERPGDTTNRRSGF